MSKVTAGLLMCSYNKGNLEYFLVHPGGPFFSKKDKGWWTIPKGLPEENEELLVAARREFMEETGIQPSPPFYSLGSIKQKGGKEVFAWAFEGTWNPEDGISSNTFELEWPPKSGRKQKFPEIDKASWFTHEEACIMIKDTQKPFLEKALVVFTREQ